VGLADQIIKRLGPILSGENLVTHALNLNGNAHRRKLLAMQTERSDRVCVRQSGVASSKEAPPVSRRGPLSNCPNYRVIVMQQAPGQQAPPPQQPSSLDEIVVALVSVIIAAIKSRYFMILSC
jgi:hypothetical protein